MAKKDKTSVIFLLDETGSMHAHYEETITGFNEYIQQLKKEKNISFTLTTFNSDTGVEVLYVDIPIARVKELTEETYKPNSTTPLYDAIGKTIKELDDRLKKKKSKPKVLFVIMTDGYENASKEYDIKAIKSLIKKKEGEDWSFIFMGINQDAWLNAKEFGFKSGNVISVMSGQIRSTLKSAGGSSVLFTQNKNRKISSFFSK